MSEMTIQSENELIKRRWVQKIMTLAAVVLVALSLVFAQYVSFNALRTERDRNNDLTSQVAVLREESACRSAIAAEVDVAALDMNIAISKALLAVQRKDAAALESYVAELNKDIADSTRVRDRRVAINEICQQPAGNK